MDYILEINKVSREIYNETLNLFEDSNLYQTYEYNLHARGEKYVYSRFEKGDIILGVSIIRIVKVPFLKFGIAYIYRGPIWQKKNSVNSIEVLTIFLELLKEEFVLKENWC
ncbi:MAG: hypothetical protein M5T52_24705 [Ignavibacteriaceae bacterium]|nr:hypothetical protein [Ignavibacteriaceae bacterium]